MLRVARSNKFKYPPCPACGAIGTKGFKTTRLGNLRCWNCNSMFELEYDKNLNITVGKSMGIK
jgi:hypothetical protein